VLSGRRALVTGGSRGIDAAIVQRLAADGAQVAFTYAPSSRPADKLRSDVSAQGGTVIAIRADSADTQQVIAAVDDAVAQLGGLDILVNNAGVANSGPVESFSFETFDRTLAINIRAVFAAIQCAIPHLGAGGRIIYFYQLRIQAADRSGSRVRCRVRSATCCVHDQHPG